MTLCFILTRRPLVCLTSGLARANENCDRTTMVETRRGARARTTRRTYTNRTVNIIDRAIRAAATAAVASTPTTSHIVEDEKAHELDDDVTSAQKTKTNVGRTANVDDDEPTTSQTIDHAAIADALTCVITGRTFEDPVTTPCGHTFEREALAKWMTRGDGERETRAGYGRDIGGGASCPQCRCALYHELPHEWPVNTTVRACVEATFGKSGTERSAIRAVGDGVDDDGGVRPSMGDVEDANSRDVGERKAPGTDVPIVGPTYRLPMFFLDALVPGQEVTLNVFEMRYKVLVRRCLMGSRKFLMMSSEDMNEEEFLHALQEDGELPEFSQAVQYGCRAMNMSLNHFGRFCVECHIVTCQELVDGRFLVRIRAMKHVYLHGATRDPAGYCVASCTEVNSLVEDTSDPDDSADLRARRADIKLMLRVERAMEIFDTWAAMTSGPRWLYNYGGKMSALLQAVGVQPDKNRSVDLAWWIVRVLNPLPTIDGTIEMRAICLNAWQLDVRYRVIAQMLVYSLVLVQHIGIRDWVKREHVIAITICDKLYDELESESGSAIYEKIRSDLMELLRNAEYHPSVESAIEGANLMLADPEERHRGVVPDHTYHEASDVFFEDVVNAMTYSYGRSSIAFAAWRVLSNFEHDSENLRRWNARLLKHFDSSELTSLFEVTGPFSDLLRRDMRSGMYKLLYFYDIVRLVLYLVYRILVLLIFGLGFLFEMLFDREFAGGPRTAMRGFIMTVMIGALCGIFARSSVDAYIAQSAPA